MQPSSARNGTVHPYVSQVVDILASNPEVWSKMALFITYDEEGGFFDHLVPPTPPRSRAEGLSTVATTNEIFPGDADHGVGPSGFGIRVPMLHAHGQLNEEGRCVSDRVPERGTGRRRLSGAVGRRRRRTADLHVEPHKHVSDAWNVRTIGRSAYDLSVSGPNGFFRGFKGDISGRRGNLDVR